MQPPFSDRLEARHRQWLQEMILIRAFETAADDLSVKGRIPGGIHPAIGQEGVAVGVMRALQPSDVVASTHRSHHHALAMGLSPRAVMAELFGKSTGVVGGRGGSMHLADFERGLWGSNGIVGGGVGLAMGYALGARQLGSPRVSVGFFGDGGANTGRVWESINLAVAWELPLVVICENNLYAVETSTASVTGGSSIADRAKGFGLPARQVDGQDVIGVHQATEESVEGARNGGGPAFLEVLTYRYRGHNSGEQATYRTDREVEDWRTLRDPIERLAKGLIEAELMTSAELAAARSEAESVVAHAVAYAEESAWPDAAVVGRGVYAWSDGRASL